MIVNVDVDVAVDFDGNLNVDGVATFDAGRTSRGSGRRVNLRNRPAIGLITPGMLSFQRLDVYQRAIEFLALTIEIVEELPRGHAAHADQLIRSAESVVRNIAEGAGRWSHADSSKHYKIARGEAMEAAASLDVLRLRKFIAPSRYDRGIELLKGVVAMLTKML